MCPFSKIAKSTTVYHSTLVYYRSLLYSLHLAGSIHRGGGGEGGGGKIFLIISPEEGDTKNRWNGAKKCSRIQCHEIKKIFIN